jgi:hypothetical protein
MFRERDYIEACPQGTYNDGTLTTLMCAPCPAGKSCIRKSAAVACASGEYSLKGEIHCHSCPIGASCLADFTDYTLCTTGQHSALGVITCSNCEVGYMCPDIFQQRQPCPPGTYQDATTQISCKPCALGFYSASYGNSVCTACPAGSYCPYADQPPVTCPFGTYSAGSQTTCSRCTDGYK